MKKLWILAGVLVSAAAVTVLLAGSGADASSCERCIFGGTTNPAWGFGATCAAATTDAINQASAMIPCDSCQETVIGLDPCNTDCSNFNTCYKPYGEWRVDVKIQYKCWENICF